MPLKSSVNAALRRITGYSLTAETPEDRQAALDRAARRAARHERLRARQRQANAVEKATRQAARRARREAAEEYRTRAAAERERRKAAEEERRRRREQRRQEQVEKRRERGEDLPPHLDEQARAVVARVRSRTMTGPPKLEALVEATRYVVREQIPGDVVECGVWRGGSMQAIALTLLDMGDTSRALHLFDTFEGMPPPTEEDSRTRFGETVSAEQMLAASEKDSKLWAIAGLEDVRQGMGETGYPADQVHYHPGMVEETTPGEAPEVIALLRLDTDWYASTRHELEHLYHRLSPGGVLMLDDYGDWDGARKATEEWLAATGEPLLLVPMGSGRIAVKPRRD